MFWNNDFNYYRSILDLLDQPVFLLDLEERFIYLNSAGAALLGQTPQALLGKSLLECGPTQAAALGQHHMPIKNQYGELMGELYLPRLMTLTPPSPPVGFFESMPIATAYFDASARLVDGNLKLVQLLGQPLAALYGSSWTQWIYGADQAMAMATFVRLQAQASSAEQCCELRLLSSRGQIFWVELFWTLIRASDEGQQILGSIWQIIDITDRKVARQLEQQRFEQLDLLAPRPT